MQTLLRSRAPRALAWLALASVSMPALAGPLTFDAALEKAATDAPSIKARASATVASGGSTTGSVVIMPPAESST